MNARRLFGLLAFLVLFSSGKVAGQVSHLNTNKHESKTFKFASFKQTHFHALLTKKLESHSVFHSDDCSFLCLKTKRCVSFNIQAEKNENPLLECELLDDDRFHSSGKFQKNGTFHHFAIQAGVVQVIANYISGFGCLFSSLKRLYFIYLIPGLWESQNSGWFLCKNIAKMKKKT